MFFAIPRPTLLVLAGLLICHSLNSSSGMAQDEERQKELAQLADKNSDVRRHAIEALGRSRDHRAAGVLQAYAQRNLYVWKGRVVLCDEVRAAGSGKRVAPLSDPLTHEPLLDSAGKALVVDANELREMGPTASERRLIQNNLLLLGDFASSDPEKRLVAVRRFGDSRNHEFLGVLEEAGQTDPDRRVRRVAREGAYLLRLTANVPEQTGTEQLRAVWQLGRMHSYRGLEVLKDLVQQGTVASEDLPVYRKAIRQIERYQFWVGIVRSLTNGLSLGSVLVLMALGLSIIYGQMGVINMAHGELMMIGAYATYEMQKVLGHTIDQPRNWYYLVAFPVAFCASAAAGWIIERLVVRHLYGRPLETLLATWGVSLILVQFARVRYGDNIGVNSPTWLVGSFEVMPDFTISYNRCFILALSALCVLFVYLLTNFTRIGLKIRATVQGRDTAESLGISTRRVDGFTFSLGAGLAGIAGYALTLIAGVTPDMGQNYIVDSFLVVVTGGVGNLAGSVCAGLGLGTLNTLLEPMTFGGAILTFGLVAVAVTWIGLAIRAARQNRRWAWLMFLVPFPLPYVIEFRSQPAVLRMGLLYLLGVAAIVVGLLRNVMLTEFLAQDIRAVWAKVLILSVVVVFIQWRPAGLFPPKGRLADV